MAALTLADIDARIAALRTEADTIGTALGELDGDVTLKLLESAKLSGQTAAEWAEVAPRLEQLWRYYGAVKDALAEVDAVRGTRPRLSSEQEQRLTTILTGQSITLPPDPRAPAPRTLNAARPTATIAWVLSAMGPLYQRIVGVVDRVGDAWTALPRLDASDAALTGLTQNASQAGLKPPAEIAAARGQIAALRERVRADPLAVNLGDVDAISRRVEAAKEILHAASQARGEMAGRLGAAAALLDETGSFLDQARSAEAEASVKILPAGAGSQAYDLDDLRARLGRLRSNLDRITQLSRGNWQEARRLLGEADQQATGLRAAAAEALAATRGPMDSRNELRGRLDAYRAKAQARGYAEDARLTEMYEQAKTALYSAPCDVAAAEALVRAYQQALSPTRPAAT